MMKPNHDPRPTPVLGGVEGIHAAWFLAAALLGGCGVDTAATVATGAAIKKQEMEQGKKTMGQVQQKLEQAAQQMQRAQAETEAASK